MWRRGNNKHGAIKKEYNGRIYHSKREADYAAELDSEKREKLIKDWKPQFKLSLDVAGHHICNYVVDFWVLNSDDVEEIREVKGYATDLWKLKWKLTEALYGHKYKMVVIK